MRREYLDCRLACNPVGLVAITRGEQALVGNPPVNKLFVCPKPEAVGIAKKHEGCSGNLQVNEVRDSVVAVALGAVAGGIVGVVVVSFVGERCQGAGLFLSLQSGFFGGKRNSGRQAARQRERKSKTESCVFDEVR